MCRRACSPVFASKDELLTRPWGRSTARIARSSAPLLRFRGSAPPPDAITAVHARCTRRVASYAYCPAHEALLYGSCIARELRMRCHTGRSAPVAQEALIVWAGAQGEGCSAQGSLGGVGRKALVLVLRDGTRKAAGQHPAVCADVPHAKASSPALSHEHPRRANRTRKQSDDAGTGAPHGLNGLVDRSVLLAHVRGQGNAPVDELISPQLAQLSDEHARQVTAILVVR